MDQRLGQTQTLLHAARKSVHKIITFVRQVQQFQNVADDALTLCLADLVGHCEEIQELPNLHAIVDAKGIGHVTHAAAHVHWIFGNAETVDRAFAATGA